MKGTSYNISEYNIKTEFNIYSVYDGVDMVAIVFYKKEKDGERSLFEMHVMSEKCSIDKVLEAVKADGIKVYSYIIVEFPSLKVYKK